MQMGLVLTQMGQPMVLLRKDLALMKMGPHWAWKRRGQIYCLHRLLLKIQKHQRHSIK